MNSWAAAVTGCIGGVFYVQTSELMLKYKLDDVVNAVAIHLSPGVWGVIAIGFFARPDNIARAYSLPLCAPFPASACVCVATKTRHLNRLGQLTECYSLPLCAPFPASACSGQDEGHLAPRPPRLPELRCVSSL